MELIGTIVRLQVQRSSLKLGERPRRWFDPAPLLEVPALALSPDGVVGLLPDGERVIDVHNREHPQSRHGSGNGISLGFTSHYAHLRSRLGARMVDGIAGENILVQTEREFRRADLPAALAIESADGLVRLEGARVIEPCVEFSRYALGYIGPPDRDLTQPDPAVAPTLQFLRFGTRGYCATYTAGPAVVKLGDRLLVSEALAEKLNRISLEAALDAMDAEYGPPSAEAEAWARRVLDPSLGIERS
jgi:hypothetical protein